MSKNDREFQISTHRAPKPIGSESPIPRQWSRRERNGVESNGGPHENSRSHQLHWLKLAPSCSPYHSRCNSMHREWYGYSNRIQRELYGISNGLLREYYKHADTVPVPSFADGNTWHCRVPPRSYKNRNTRLAYGRFSG